MQRPTPQSRALGRKCAVFLQHPRAGAEPESSDEGGLVVAKGCVLRAPPSALLCNTSNCRCRCACACLSVSAHSHSYTFAVLHRTSAHDVKRDYCFCAVARPPCSSAQASGCSFQPKRRLLQFAETTRLPASACAASLRMKRRNDRDHASSDATLRAPAEACITKLLSLPVSDDTLVCVAILPLRTLASLSPCSKLYDLSCPPCPSTKIPSAVTPAATTRTSVSPPLLAS